MITRAIHDVIAERGRQRTLGYDDTHDDGHGVLHLIEWSGTYLDRAAGQPGTPSTMRADLVKGQSAQPVRFAYPQTGPRTPQAIFALVDTKVDDHHEGGSLLSWTFESLSKIQGDFLREIGASV